MPQQIRRPSTGATSCATSAAPARHNPPLASAGNRDPGGSHPPSAARGPGARFRKVDRALEELRTQYEALADAEPLRPAAVNLILSKVEALTEAVVKVLPGATP